MKIVGITGGIGSGKSEVSKILRILGYPVYDSDLRGRWISDHHPEVIQKIKNLFGNSIYDDNGLKRGEVASIVFENSNMLSALNQIIHPVVAKDFNLFVSGISNSTIVFKESALLFESGAYQQLDKVIYISAPENIRIKRVMNRDRATETSVIARIRNQWPADKSSSLADFIVIADDNHFIVPQIMHILEELLKSDQTIEIIDKNKN